jgi:hypothetical protein
LKWFLAHFASVLKSKEGVNASLDPLIDLNNRVAKAIFQKMSLGLFQEDRLLVAFLLATNLIAGDVKISEAQLKFIGKGSCASLEVPLEVMTQAEKEEREVR